jgi:hypothetical protein
MQEICRICRLCPFMACNVHNMQNMTKRMRYIARNMTLNMQNMHLSFMRSMAFQAMFSKKIVGCADFQVMIMIDWNWGGRGGGGGEALFCVWCESLRGSPLQAPLARPIGQTHWPDPLARPIGQTQLSPCHMGLAMLPARAWPWRPDITLKIEDSNLQSLAAPQQHSSTSAAQQYR